MKKFTEVGTDIEEVKRQNANSGMSYNEVKAYLAQKTIEQNLSTDNKGQGRK